MKKRKRASRKKQPENEDVSDESSEKNNMKAPPTGFGVTSKTVQSKSLINFSQMPGWNEQENRILRYGIMKFGVGSWSTIHRAGILPGKNFAQLYIQTQRMLGVQSLAQFNGIQLDTDMVRKDSESIVEELHNKRKNGEKSTLGIKNGLIVNTNGANPTKESIKKKLEKNREKYELSKEEIEAIDEEEMYALKRNRRLEFTDHLKTYLTQKNNEIIPDMDEYVSDNSLDDIKEQLVEAKMELGNMMQKFYDCYC